MPDTRRYLLAATTWQKIVVAVVWTDDSSNGGTTFSVLNLDDLSTVCTRTTLARTRELMAAQRTSQPRSGRP